MLKIKMSGPEAQVLGILNAVNKDGKAHRDLESASHIPDDSMGGIPENLQEINSTLTRVIGPILSGKWRKICDQVFMGQKYSKRDLNAVIEAYKSDRAN